MLKEAIRRRREETSLDKIEGRIESSS